MIQWHRVCIVGVGLLGGSIGLALRHRQLANEIIGVGRNPASLSRALQKNAIDRAATSIPDAARDADLVVVCTPVQQIVMGLEQASQVCAPNACLTDVGSTKANIVRAIEGQGIGAPVSTMAKRFVGSHPLAGSEKSGVEFASADLFENRVCILTPTSHTEQNAMQAAHALWSALGAQIRIMDADEHDAALAITSHLPHLIAAALAGMTPSPLLDLTAGGWRDTTRIAAGNPEMWRQIIQENRTPVLRELKNFATIWQRWIEAVEADDSGQLEHLLLAGKQIRDAVGNRHLSG